MRDRKGVDLNVWMQRDVGETGGSKGNGNHNQDIFCEEKNSILNIKRIR